MSLEILFSLIVFAFVSTVTPGPNNLMLLASGTNFGFRRTIPHMIGIALGFSFMVLVVGLGVSGIFERWPIAHTVLKWASLVYMLWLAWKIATASAPGTKEVDAKPMTFLQAALFQWVNPKAWSMALSAVTLYAPKNEIRLLLIVALVFAVVNGPSVSLWTAMGQKMRAWLSSPKHLRAFNWTMAFLLVASLALMI